MRGNNCWRDLRRLRQGRAIVGDERFDSLAAQLMLNVEALPWLVESELLIEDRNRGMSALLPISAPSICSKMHTIPAQLCDRTN